MFQAPFSLSGLFEVQRETTIVHIPLLVDGGQLGLGTLPVYKNESIAVAAKSETFVADMLIGVCGAPKQSVSHLLAEWQKFIEEPPNRFVSENNPFNQLWRIFYVSNFN